MLTVTSSKSQSFHQLICHIKSILGQKPINGGKPAKVAKIISIYIINFSSWPVLYRSDKYVKKYILNCVANKVNKINIEIYIMSRNNAKLNGYCVRRAVRIRLNWMAARKPNKDLKFRT